MTGQRNLVTRVFLAKLQDRLICGREHITEFTSEQATRKQIDNRHINSLSFHHFEGEGAGGE